VELLRKPLLLILQVTTIIFLLTSQTSFAAVGKILEQTGPTEIVRDKKSIEGKVNTSIEMNDTVVTAKSKAKLVFEDKTTVNITEQSKLVIDDFVYDPKKGSGKLAMKVVMGTARYASGQIAKNDPQQVNIQTPTATVAVRGTDFSMTVDELGRSLIVLLPSCDNNSCVTGAIQVSNSAGSVFMDKAYQTTLVSSLNSSPSTPIIVTIDQANINNLLIIAPPKEVKSDINRSDTTKETALDVNFLNKDFLKYNDLDVNELSKFNALDINFLDVNLLTNLLDDSNKTLSQSQESILAQKSLLPGYNEASGLKYVIDDMGKLTLNKIVTGSNAVQVSVSQEANLQLNISQAGSPLYQKINSGGTTTITIIQK
jgi:hypothetical protein